ncbi:protein BPS1, chloroplastic-like [Rhodamnia argentea]|uniref:Protein BPS1, chloroplastic-like n=1 Tax=Rhodamnia argentea TaxID=178133 RepID=A0A8B8NPH7_9MYRT|nr:protein BPS1, chloroplastic-like [Rhodamnia argentea]
MYTRLLSPSDKKGAKLTAEELDSISSSFDESLHSRLWGLSPASASLPWLSSAVDVLTVAHSAVKSLIYELKSDGGDCLLSWYLDNSVKVLDVCNCISSDIEWLCLRHLNRRITIELLRSEGNPSEEEIHQARDLLADSEGEGGSGYVKPAADIEELIRDLATGIGKPALLGEDTPVDGVVQRAVQAVGFVTAFVAGVIASALRSSSGAVFCVCVPEGFPWGDSIRAIESTVIMESSRGEERDRKTRVLKELDDVGAHTRQVHEAINEVVASGGSGENIGRLREAAVGLEQANEAMLEGLYRLRDGMNELFLTVVRIRKKMVDDFRASLWDGPLPKKPPKPGKNE